MICIYCTFKEFIGTELRKPAFCQMLTDVLLCLLHIRKNVEHDHPSLALMEQLLCKLNTAVDEHACHDVFSEEHVFLLRLCRRLCVPWFRFRVDD